MNGWMYRFKGGPLDGKTFGPAEQEPPEEVEACDVGGLYLVPLGANVMELDTARYRRIAKSTLGDDVPDGLVKGAEYEFVDIAPEPWNP